MYGKWAVNELYTFQRVPALNIDVPCQFEWLTNKPELFKVCPERLQQPRSDRLVGSNLHLALNSVFESCE